ncbi:hypothetical protein RchiOBHm_Chr2g0164861 [Rosa chinensis]|uniref:Uncharacterized protein n=1 Tax=Rosa chinensis TaxID=74649 RepID=A0A2P6S3N9_ROSCH|nr:hypothetical protein RchiOBHm_Chr2g0164861 [Rosa chinensis]
MLRIKIMTVQLYIAKIVYPKPNAMPIYGFESVFTCKAYIIVTRPDLFLASLRAAMALLYGLEHKLYAFFN